MLGEHVITAYPSRPADQKRTLRPRTPEGIGEMTTEMNTGHDALCRHRRQGDILGRHD